MRGEGGVSLQVDGRAARSYNLERYNSATVTFGRAPDNLIVVDMPFVSKYHGRFVRSADGWLVEDLGSTNGIYIGGKRVAREALRDGDRLVLGGREECVLIYAQTQQRENMIRVPLRTDRVTMLGRGEHCDIRLNHPSVSRVHCNIAYVKGRFVIHDANSTNGLLVNGEPLRGNRVLSPMDHIVVGGVDMLFMDGALQYAKEQPAAGIVARGVTKRVRARRGAKVLVDDVSLSVEPGEFVALIGGSGAGKTTLLNCLSGATGFQEGSVVINGHDITRGYATLKHLIGYVPQRDIVYDNLTLRRMLYYSAKLRMPGDVTRAEINERIDSVLEMVELTAQRDMLIGKLSGGQKKRASIAVELLAAPKLFFLDEPSSGLDPGTEKNLMLMLRKLTQARKTVVMVTHTVQNIDLCDKVICMGTGGKLCFAGSPREALEFFGVDNFADVYQSLNRDAQTCSRRYRGLNPAPPAPKAAGRARRVRRGMLCGLRAYGVLTRRYVALSLHDVKRVLLLLLMAPALGAMVCVAFNTLSPYDGTFPFQCSGDTMKYMFSIACCVFWVGIFNSIQEICKEAVILARERMAGLGLAPYVASKLTVLGTLCAVQSLEIMAVVKLCTDMPSEGMVLSGGLFQELTLTTFLTAFCAMCVGLCVSAMSSNPDRAIVAAPICLMPQILFSGLACDLEGIAQDIAYFVTCRWSCIAYFTSANVNGMPESVVYGFANALESSTEAVYVDKAYDFAYYALFPDLDPIRTAWLILALYAAGCVVLAGVPLCLRNRANYGRNARRIRK